MRFPTAVLCLLALALRPAAAQTNSGAVPAECVETKTAGLDTGQPTEAEGPGFDSPGSGSVGKNALCTGLVLHNRATVAASAGRLAEAEGLEERALRILSAGRDPRDPILLRPLFILWSVRFQQGGIGRAREAFRALRSIPLAQAEDRAIVSGAAAEQLLIEGRYGEAEREFRYALREADGAGLARTAYAASLVTGLGSLYLIQGRYRDADSALLRAFEIVGSSNHTLPADRMKLLAVRGCLRAREERWREAEEDLSAAVAIAERETTLDPALVKPILLSDAIILRKMHRNKQARSVEDRARSIGTLALADDVVDIIELSGEFKRKK